MKEYIKPILVMIKLTSEERLAGSCHPSNGNGGMGHGWGHGWGRGRGRW